MLTPEMINKFVIEQYDKYLEGLINDVDYAGSIFTQCELFLRREQDKADARCDKIQDIIDGV